jgi:hypothetical protein
MTICVTIHAKDYATKEEAFSTLKEYVDKGIACAYDSRGTDYEEAQWVLNELSAYMDIVIRLRRGSIWREAGR